MAKTEVHLYSFPFSALLCSPVLTSDLYQSHKDSESQPLPLNKAADKRVSAELLKYLGKGRLVVVCVRVFSSRERLVVSLLRVFTFDLK